MTARGEHLRKLVEGDDARISIRALAKRLAAREDIKADDLETVRRTLQRHVKQKEAEEDDEDRDVSDSYVKAISEVLNLDPASWPARRRQPTKAELRREVASLKRQLDAAREALNQARTEPP